MTPADAAAFSDALRAAFPDMRFVSEDYWKHFVDWSRFKDDCREHERRYDQRLPRKPLFYHLRDLAGESLHYWDSLADTAETDFRAWIEPRGWHPEWGPPNRHGVSEIENMPALEFVFQRSEFRFMHPERLYPFNDEPVATNHREAIALQGRTFEVLWDRFDVEGEAFGKKVFNILRRLTVERFISVERKSRRAFSSMPVRHPSWCLAGHHADAWTLKRRHNYLQGDSGPYMKSAAYRFRPADIFTDAEVAQFQARQKALLEAEIKRRLAAATRGPGRKPKELS